jgi:alpha-1,2-mannosyltransferase
MALLALCLEPLVGRRAAVLAGLIGGVGTGTWSVSADSLWPHSVNQLLMALALYGMTRRSYLLVGVACMLAEPVRTHLAVVALALGIGAVVAERRLRPLFLIGVPAVVGCLAVPLYTHHVYGVASLKADYGSRGSFSGGVITSYTPWDTVVNVLGFFLSPDRGLLLMSPFLLALLPGVRAAWRVAPAWVRCSALGGVAYLLVQARLNSFTGGVRFWSYRLSLESLTLFAPLLALAWQQRIHGHAGRARTFAALVAASVAFTALGAVLFTPRWPMRTWLHSWVLHLLAIGPHRTAALVVMLLGCAAAAACFSRPRSAAMTGPSRRRATASASG